MVSNWSKMWNIFKIFLILLLFLPPSFTFWGFPSFLVKLNWTVGSGKLNWSFHSLLIQLVFPGLTLWRQERWPPVWSSYFAHSSFFVESTRLLMKRLHNCFFWSCVTLRCPGYQVVYWIPWGIKGVLLQNGCPGYQEVSLRTHSLPGCSPPNLTPSSSSSSKT